MHKTVHKIDIGKAWRMLEVPDESTYITTYYDSSDEGGLID